MRLNGFCKMIIEFLPAITMSDNNNSSIRHIANSTHALMLAKINEISEEVGNPLQPTEAVKVG